MAMIHQQLRSSQPGAVPQPTDLLVGQLAINLADRKIYTLNNTNSVITLGLAPSDVSAVAITGSWNDLLDRPNVSSEYILPPASSGVLGGIKPSTGLQVTSDGTLSANVVSVQGKTGTITLTGDDLGIPDLLGVDGKIESIYLPDSLLGAVTYQGVWNASTNTPTIPPAAAGNKGQYYVVNVAGNTTIDGNTSWLEGDWIISDGTKWSKIRFGSSAVLTVNGNVGDVVINAANLPNLSAVGKSNLYTDLSAIPTSFPPSAHTHTVSQITDIATVAKTGSYTDLINLPPDVTIANVGVSIVGSPTLLYDVRYIFTRNIQFTTNFSGSRAVIDFNSGTVGTVGIQKNGTQIGTIQNDGTSTTFTMVGPTQTFAPGDVLTYVWLTSNITAVSITLQGHWI